MSDAVPNEGEVIARERPAPLPAPIPEGATPPPGAPGKPLKVESRALPEIQEDYDACCKAIGHLMISAKMSEQRVHALVMTGIALDREGAISMEAASKAAQAIKEAADAAAVKSAAEPTAESTEPAPSAS